MAEIGKVVKISGRLIQLELSRTAACGGCKACVPMDGKNTMTTFALNECGARVGDQVELVPGEGTRIFPAIYLYGIPLAVFMLSVLLCTRFLNDLTALLISLGLLALTYPVLWLIGRKLNTEKYTHRAIRVLGGKQDE